MKGGTTLDSRWMERRQKKKEKKGSRKNPRVNIFQALIKLIRQLLARQFLVVGKESRQKRGAKWRQRSSFIVDGGKWILAKAFLLVALTTFLFVAFTALANKKASFLVSGQIANGLFQTF